MSHGVRKETYIDADERTTKALTYDLLINLYDTMEKANECHSRHLDICNKRFEKLEEKRKRDTITASVSGFVGGFIAMIAYFIKQWFSE